MSSGFKKKMSVRGRESERKNNGNKVKKEKKS